MSSKEEEIAEQALSLIGRGGRAIEEAAILLSRHLHIRMQHYFQRHRVPTNEAEELVSDVWMKLINSRYDGQARPVVWMWTLANSVLLDWVDRQKTQKRGGNRTDGATELTVDEETWSTLEKTVPAVATAEWVRLCVARAIEQLQQDDPNRSEVLRFVYEGWSAEEIAIFYGVKPPVSNQQLNAARNRVLEANKKARSYFAHCRES